MPLLPEEITSQSFRRQRWGGYDRGQVDAFLRRVQLDYAAAIHRIGAVAEDRSRSAASWDELARELAAIASDGHDAVRKARDDAEAEATAIRQRAEHAAAAMLEHAEQAAAATTHQAEQLRSAAQQYADNASKRLDDARQHAQQIEDHARHRADTLRRDADDRRARLEAAERNLLDRLRETNGAINTLRSQTELADQLQALINDVQTGTITTGSAGPASEEPTATNGGVH